MGYPFGKSQYLEAYIEMIEYMRGRGINVFIIRGETYLWNGIFSSAWNLVKKSDARYDFEEKRNIYIDMILDRSDSLYKYIVDDIRIINHKKITQLCSDKILTFEAFSKISPKTAYIHSFQELEQTIQYFDLKWDDMIVLKKNFWLHGNGVFIWKVSEIASDYYDDWSDILVQEFIDSSGGIPSLVSGLHDIRINVVWWKMTHAFIRTPQEGSYLANVAQGGSVTTVAISDLPQEILDCMKQIIHTMNQIDPIHIFAADFVYWGAKFYLIELNSFPGVGHSSKTKNYWDFNGAICELILQEI